MIWRTCGPAPLLETGQNRGTRGTFATGPPQAPPARLEHSAPEPQEETPLPEAAPDRARYPDLAGKTVFVSGGGSGIGAAFVRAFAGQGCRVAFVDIADAPSQALAAELGAAVRTGTATCATSGAARGDRRGGDDARARPRAGQQRRARRPPPARRRDARVLGREPGDQPAPPRLRRAGGRARHGGGGRRLDRQPGLDLVDARAAPSSPATRRPRRPSGPHPHARAGARRDEHPRQLDRARGRRDGAAGRRCGCRREKERQFLEQQCLKFRLSEDDVAGAALFLASDGARAITGQSLVVDGGLAQTSVVA